ncbi:hypothetical protein P3342_001278 [Pyrenophora teres f. teres]|nr:hypothetical protein P3342_001278 [Pyrenophora teres f. teres]
MVSVVSIVSNRVKGEHGAAMAKSKRPCVQHVQCAKVSGTYASMRGGPIDVLAGALVVHRGGDLVCVVLDRRRSGHNVVDAGQPSRGSAPDWVGRHSRDSRENARHAAGSTWFQEV